jgi:nucleoside 2-deoxyribosyltransferase
MKTIYLAGPDVFLPDALEKGEEMKRVCAAYGHAGHFPLDNVIEGSDPIDVAEKIRIANVEMIRGCDVVIANLSPFRGPEPDSGTVWEVGFADALGKIVIAYSADRQTLKSRTQRILGVGDAAYDNAGMVIEDFGLSHNLMFAHCVVGSTLEAALEYLNALEKAGNLR